MTHFAYTLMMNVKKPITAYHGIYTNPCDNSISTRCDIHYQQSQYFQISLLYNKVYNN